MCSNPGVLNNPLDSIHQTMENLETIAVLQYVANLIPPLGDPDRPVDIDGNTIIRWLDSYANNQFSHLIKNDKELVIPPDLSGNPHPKIYDKITGYRIGGAIVLDIFNKSALLQRKENKEPGAMHEIDDYTTQAIEHIKAQSHENLVSHNHPPHNLPAIIAGRLMNMEWHHLQFQEKNLPSEQFHKIVMEKGLKAVLDEVLKLNGLNALPTKHKERKDFLKMFREYLESVSLSLQVPLPETWRSQNNPSLPAN